MKLRKSFVVAAAVGAAAVAGTALASIPGPDGVIHTCYTKSTGGIRIIDSAGELQVGRDLARVEPEGADRAAGAGGACRAEGRHGGCSGA